MAIPGAPADRSLVRNARRGNHGRKRTKGNQITVHRVEVVIRGRPEQIQAFRLEPPAEFGEIVLFVVD